MFTRYVWKQPIFSFMMFCWTIFALLLWAILSILVKANILHSMIFLWNGEFLIKTACFCVQWKKQFASVSTFELFRALGANKTIFHNAFPPKYITNLTKLIVKNNWNKICKLWMSRCLNFVLACAPFGTPHLSLHRGLPNCYYLSLNCTNTI